MKNPSSQVLRKYYITQSPTLGMGGYRYVTHDEGCIFVHCVIQMQFHASLRNANKWQTFEWGDVFTFSRRACRVMEIIMTTDLATDTQYKKVTSCMITM